MRLILAKKKKAQSLIEYALILAMVAVVAIAALQLLGNNIGGALRGAASTVGQGAENAGRNACESMGDGFEWHPVGNDGGGNCVYVNNGDGGEAAGG